jgi:hypothetical protein
MKNTTLLFIFLIVSAKAFSQIDTDETQMFQTLFGMQKKEIVSEFVKTDNTNKDQFWKLYEEYESNRKQLGQKKFAALNNYVKNYSKLNEAETDEVMRDVIDLANSQDKLISKYYFKIKKSVGIAVAAQFYQIEWYLQSQIRTNILENIPAIDKFDVKK